MNNQAASWEAVEVNLNDRLLESQMHLIASEEKVGIWEDTADDTRVTELGCIRK